MGILSAIQRFSLHDGPGIRSTVFFKGCNMRCAWCHNPETFIMQPEVLFYESKCVHCGACATVCPAHEEIGGHMAFDLELCNTQCAQHCYSGALEMCGQEMSVYEVLHEVMQDYPYYERSGGGVTLSGGEVLVQPEFALELLRALGERNVRTAIESNFCTAFDKIEPLLHHVNLLICDLKLWDPAAHKQWTGQDNVLILDNLERASDRDIPMVLRTPVIPGVNDTEAEIGAIADFAAKLPSLQYYELLNFNPLGHSKYLALGVDNPFVDARPLSDARMEELVACASAAGITVRKG